MEGHLVGNGLRRRSELITWKGLSLCTLAPGGPQGHTLQDVTGEIL